MVDGYARRRLGRLVVFGGSPAPAWARARTQPDQAPLFEILENGIKSEWIGSTHGGEQILLAGLPQLRQQGPFAAIAPEFRQLLADAENDIDRRLPPFVRRLPRQCFQGQFLQEHRSRLLRFETVGFQTLLCSLIFERRHKVKPSQDETVTR